MAQGRPETGDGHIKACEAAIAGQVPAATARAAFEAAAIAELMLARPYGG